MEGTILWDIREWVAEFARSCNMVRVERAYPGTCSDIVGAALKSSLSDNCSLLSDCLFGHFDLNAHLGPKCLREDPEYVEAYRQGCIESHNELLTWLVDRTQDWMAEMHQVVSGIASEFDDYNIDDINLLSKDHVKVDIVGVYHDWVMNEHPVEPLQEARRKW